ncbi:unnamed protein product [Cylindrotheca closterium]|uniref:Uncharacterized protein n=1 Tax=Cylindrotheca closterium TaxID=2856 RepID=A0AAD2CLA5_9STRA|nr:unnamed protein product [Cylindrotheca closterium]
MESWPNLKIRKVVQHAKFDNQTERFKFLAEFYRVPVADSRGTTAFNMYFLIDHEPKYEERPSTKGKRLVNVSVFDLKKELRTMMGGGHGIHATDNIQETKENMEALELPFEYQQRRFESLRQVFDALEFAGTKYVVLRNFEKMPDEIAVIDPAHLEVDLLVADYYEAKRVLDAITPYKLWSKSYEIGRYRIANQVIVAGKLVYFNLRWVGDSYLDRKWQLQILNQRRRLRDVYVPCDQNHLYSLIYHVTIQKKSISPTYVSVIMELGNFTNAEATDKTFLRSQLDAFMKRNGYLMVKPHDHTVYFFEQAGLE